MDLQIVGVTAWPAIADEETWRVVHATLTDPARRKQQGNEPRWLGSGLYRCGICGGLLRAAPFGGTPSRPSNKRKYHYRCTNFAHLTVQVEHTDEYVRGAVADLVRDPRVVAAMQPMNTHLTGDRAHRTVLAARLADFEADYARGAVTGAQLQKATAIVNAELAEVDARLAVGLQRSSASPIVNAVDPGQAFLDAPVDIQRAVLAAVPTVEVMPQPAGGGVWTPDRLVLGVPSTS